MKELDISKNILLLKNEKTQYNAILQFRSIKEKKIAPQLLPHLSDSDWLIRWIVIETLARLKFFSAIPQIIAMLYDKDFQVRKKVKETLTNFGPKSIKYLIPYLSNFDQNIRALIIQTIKNMGQNSIKYLVVALPECDWISANRITQLFWCIGDEKAEEALIQALAFPFTQKSAIVFLGNMKCKKSIPHLLSLYHIYSLRRLIIQSLSQIGQEESYPFIVEMLFSTSLTIANQAMLAITRIGRPIIPYLVKVLIKDMNKSQSILEIISKLNPGKYVNDIHHLAQQNREFKVIAKEFLEKYPYNLNLAMIKTKSQSFTNNSVTKKN